MHIYFSEKHRLHNTDQVIVNNQPYDIEEVPARADIILDSLRSANLGQILPPDDHGLEPILKIHTKDFVHHLQNIFSEQAAFYGEKQPVFPETFATRPVRHRPACLFGRKGYYAFGVGSPILEGTWQAAYWSAQCALSGADQLLQDAHAAYSLCRPPGHHAASDIYGGFCYLNNAAIAARFLDARTTILDIDYHHGNGTQEIFYQDPDVLYCSLHADPDDDYPYFWGGADELGEGPGLGYNRNWPLPQHINDSEYLAVLDEALEVIAAFSPKYLVVSLGLDIGAGDPVGGFSITNDGFRQIGQRISDLRLPTLIIQEGGYMLDTLGTNGIAFLQNFI
jgi:acetoin utilization deacetylase AcuC-like enzyme